MNQNFFSKGQNKVVASKIKDFLNKQEDLLSVRTANSPRAVGDAIQDLLEDNFAKFIGSDGKNFNSSFARRANMLVVRDVHFTPIETFSWECLTIGALGWGQIQIANSNHITIDEKITRKSWMLELCDTMLEFYPREILKTDKRIKKFEQIKQFWLKK